MFETVTVDDAIKRGRRMVTYPVIIIILTIGGISVYLGMRQSITEEAAVIGMILSLVLGFLYRSIMITKWRLWAFDNVRNINELERRATRERLIWPKGTLYGNTEIRTPLQKQRWNSLQQKFDQEDLFNDDLTVPSQTIIYYSKTHNYLYLAIGFVLLLPGIYMLLKTKTEEHFRDFGFIIVGIIIIYRNYRQVRNRAPQIILNEKGIQTSSTTFYEWKDIDMEEVVRESKFTASHDYLVYHFPVGNEKLMIDNFDITLKDLNRLVVIYRGRHTKKNKSR